MEQREPDPSDAEEALPHAAAFARESGPATLTAEAGPTPRSPASFDDDEDDDRDEDDDAPAGRPARVDPRLLDPDVIERARRVEIYRRLIEEDPQTSMFARPDSPPRRAVPPPKTLEL